MPYGGTTPEQDKKIERCVERLLKNPKFKPREEGQTKKQAAIAICKTQIVKHSLHQIIDKYGEQDV